MPSNVAPPPQSVLAALYGEHIISFSFEAKEISYWTYRHTHAFLLLLLPRRPLYILEYILLMHAPSTPPAPGLFMCSLTHSRCFPLLSLFLQPHSLFIHSSVGMSSWAHRPSTTPNKTHTPQQSVIKQIFYSSIHCPPFSPYLYRTVLLTHSWFCTR